MFRHKLRTGSHLAWCLLWGNLCAGLGGFGRGPIKGIGEVWAALGRLWSAVVATYQLHGRYRVARLVQLCLESGVARKTLEKNPEAVFTLTEELNAQQRFEDIIALVTPLIGGGPEHGKLYGARGMAYLGLGRYTEAIADLDKVYELRPQLARDFQYNLYRSYLYGLRGDLPAARQAMAAQMVKEPHGGTPEEVLAGFLAARLSPYLGPLGLRGTVGVVIGSFHGAVGHAILDPFHFIQLFRHRFDNLLLVHAPYGNYTPTTRLAAFILDQYVEQIEIGDLDTLNFAWQSLGELKHDNYTFLVHHYWSLNRMAFQARTSPEHPMAEKRDYMRLPPKMEARAEAICLRNHLDISRPIVIVHTREHGYHGLRGQYYRNTDIRNYIPALRKLAGLGYQVVRIGDRKMTSVRREVPGLVELTGTDYYDPVLDPFFISRCVFMISCQSGPCSYARVMGKPNLVVNAVYHYTLLPETTELIAFKKYRDAATGRELGVEELLQGSAHLFDRTEHFDRAGIVVEDMTPDEILAATDEMLAWLANPATPETPAQARFRGLMKAYASNAGATHPMIHPAADYIGYALPECRVSDAVCKLRPGYLEPPGAEPERSALRAA